MVNEYEYDENTQRMRVNCIGCIYGKSIEDYPICMATTVDKLIELRRIPRIVLAGTREYEYDFDQARMLFELANAIIRIREEKLLSIKNLIKHKECEEALPERLDFLRKVLTDLKYDPIDSYKKIVREIRHNEIKLGKLKKIVQTDVDDTYSLLYPGEILYEEYQEDQQIYGKGCTDCIEHYILNSLMKIKTILDRCKIIKMYLDLKEKGQLLEKTGDRSFYRKIFHPTTKPNFMYTRFLLTPPPKSELVERYKVGDAEIEIYKLPGKERKLYHLIPPEFRLTEQEYDILEKGRKYLGTHIPKEGEIEIESEKFRQNMLTLSTDMIKDIAKIQKL